MRQFLLQITVWEVKGARKGKTVHDQGAWGTNWKSVFYGKLTRTTIPKILSVSPLTTKEHPCKVKKKSARQFFHQFMKKSIFEFFINYEKTALQIFFLLCKDVLW